jgi:hypothetical protein
MTGLPSIQELISSGMAWKLEGHIGRVCMDAIQSGHAMLGEEGHRDFWGSYIPSRTEVEPDSPGSPEFYQATQDDADAFMREHIVVIQIQT